MSHRIFLATLICLLTSIIFAQPGQAPPRGNGIGGGAGMIGGNGRMMVVGGGTGGQFKQQTLDALKSQLGVSDEEWEKLSPKIEKVMDAKQKTFTGAGLSWSSRNGGAPTFQLSESKMDSPAGKAMQEARDAVANPDTSDEEITKKLTAIKEAVAKARAEFQAAQQELKESLTPRQRATLVMTGHLEE